MGEPSLAQAATSAGAFGGSVVAGLGVLKLLGSGFTWLLTRVDKKEAELVKRLEEQVRLLTERSEKNETQIRNLWMVVNCVAPALYAHDPQNAALKLAAKILGDSFPLDPNTPADMAASLDKLK